MDFYDLENNHTISPNYSNNKKRLSHEQVRLLERSFSSSRKLEPERKLQLASQLGIPPRQVAVWYQNKRARWRTQSLEMDCSAMQVRLDHAVAEKRMLQKEVARLRTELQNAKKLLFAADYKNNNNNNNHHHHHHHHHHEVEVEVEGSAGSSSFCDIVNYNNSNNSNISYQDGATLNIDDDDEQVLQFDPDLFASVIHGSDDHDRSFFD